ncbi:O-antigen polysaccharide polymerase Wzy [Priestia megaterium]|uniref:O-antigen polysaccharide polymerase Wzy n=1 Tax=Priestia megaterium TaxID=1404 RepID=UPI003D074106
MKLRISISSLIYLLVNIILIVPIFVMLREDCNVYITVVVLVQLLLSIRALRKLDIPLYSLQVLFILLSTIFHFGQAYLLAIGRIDLFNYTNIDLARSMRTYNLANIFALFVQSFVVCGMLNIRVFLKNKNSIPKKQVIRNDELKRVYRIGTLLFCIGVVPNFVYYFTQVKIILAGGNYAGIREAIDYGPVTLLKTFYTPGILMMLIGSKHNKRRAQIITIVGILFECYCMISGNRAQQILMILSFLFIYYRLVSRITPFKVFLFLFVGYYFSGVLYFISAYRNFNISDGENLQERFLSILSGGPIYDLLAQLGSNLNVVTLTLVSIPEYHSFNYGLTYLISWLSIYPNTGGILGDIPNMYVFLNYLETNLPLGGSYIGELYFNFGWFSFPIAVLVGSFIGYVGNKIEDSINQNNWIEFSIGMVLFSKLLWWIRDYFFSWIFIFIWSALVIYVLNKYFIEIANRKR